MADDDSLRQLADRIQARAAPAQAGRSRRQRPGGSLRGRGREREAAINIIPCRYVFSAGKISDGPSLIALGKVIP
jgi:hypothetical protein